MGYTRTWAEVVNMCKPFVKNIPLTGGNVDVMACDFTSSTMAAEYPFKEEIQTIASASIPLVDGQQDYDVPVNLYRLERARIVRTDISPNQFFELDVINQIPPDLTVVSPMAVRIIAHEAGVGKLRLEKAVQVAAGTTWEIQGEYQINPTKVSALSQDIWFDDKYVPVAREGVLYYLYQLADDTRAGEVQTDGRGRRAYTGQLGKFMDKLWAMRAAEDQSDATQFFPSESIGISRDTWYPNIFGL